MTAEPQTDDIADEATEDIETLRRYFDAKQLVRDFEVSLFTKTRDFIALEDTLCTYGEFLERYPEAENQSSKS